jgi:inner membrane transporter RhtA
MFKSVLILILAMASIQFGASQAKQLFAVLGVAGTSTLRLLFASLIMVAVFRPWRTKFTKAMIKSLIFYGASLGLMNFSFYFALQRIPLGIAVALEFLGPLSVAIFSLKKKIDYLWALLAGIGIILLLPKETATHSLDPLGMFLAILAGAFWAAYIIFGKRAGNDLKGEVASSMGMLVAALIVLPIGIAIDGQNLLNTSALPLALMVAVFGSALPYTLEMFALKKLPTQTFGVLMSLEPALAALMGFLFLAEDLTLYQWLAIFCVIISSLGSTLSQKKEK